MICLSAEHKKIELLLKKIFSYAHDLISNKLIVLFIICHYCGAGLRFGNVACIANIFFISFKDSITPRNKLQALETKSLICAQTNSIYHD